MSRTLQILYSEFSRGNRTNRISIYVDTYMRFIMGIGSHNHGSQRDSHALPPVILEAEGW